MAYTTINKSTDYFQTELWSSQDTSIDTINFAPDWVWIKSRTNADTQVLFDRVRGANKRLVSSSSGAEATTSDELTAFNSDGYTLGTGSNVNRASNNYVSWNWRAAGTTGSANTDGSISSTVSANTTAGFSIVSYTGNETQGATVGHGLGVTPKIILVKNRDSTLGDTVVDWVMYHVSTGNTKGTLLNSNVATETLNGYWNDTSPTSSVFTIGGGSQGGRYKTNKNNEGYIAYCFAEKTGYSKFGSYTGNGNADGAFVYTGFKPAFVLIKRSDGTPNWTINDTARDPTNVNNLRLFPNQNVVESSGSDSMDMLSNGFKLRSTDGGNNFSGGTFIYMAFGQSLVGTNNVPCTAR